MKYAYDLHIHSVLSPCADVLMTPHNIFNMANIKGLNIIAVTDHNSCLQLKVLEEISKSYDMLFIPGIEVTVKEDFDVLCYFKTVDDAIKFDQQLDVYKIKETYDTDLFGMQEITNIYDETIDLYPYLLTNKLDITFESLQGLLKPFEHILVFAHIDRPFRSGIAHIDKIKDKTIIEYKHKKPEDIHGRWVYNSDAHQIVDILERTEKNMIDLDKLDIDCFFRVFNDE
jgi:PHP family Zn ribbon phosphoesterase